MSPRHLLLVTGARALTDTPAAEAWARGILRERIAGLPAGAWLFAGDAPGPDDWTAEIADEIGVCRARYKLDGLVVVRHTDPKRSGWKHWADAAVARAQRGTRTWPLERNRALVEATAKVAADGWSVTVLGLRAPWAHTNGTAHTLGLARRAGLTVEEHVAPAECGPRTEAGR